MDEDQSLWMFISYPVDDWVALRIIGSRKGGMWVVQNSHPVILGVALSLFFIWTSAIQLQNKVEYERNEKTQTKKTVYI